MNNSPSPNLGVQTSWRWWVCGVLLLATLLNYMDRQALAQTATELKARFDLHDARYGLIEKGFSWAFAVGSVLFGWLADRFGPRRLYPLVLIGWSIAGVMTPFAAFSDVTEGLENIGDDPGAGTFRWILLCRTTLGFFEAGHWPCALITARQILSVNDRSFGNAVLQGGASAGAVLTPLYVLLVRTLGGSWGIIFWTIGLVGLLWVPVWFALVRRGDLDDRAAEADKLPAEAIDVVGFLRRLVVLLIIVTCLGVCWQFIRAWLPKYLLEFHRYSETLTDLAVAGYYLVAGVGCVLAGYSVKWLTERGWDVHPARVAAFAGWAALTALAAVVPWLGGSPWLVVPVLTLAGAGILGLHPVYYALAQDLPRRYMGVISGALAAVTWLIVGEAQGRIGAHIKATGSYDIGFILAGLAPLLGLLALVFLWKPEREKT